MNQNPDIEWLHKFINCVPFGEHCPAEDMTRAHEIVNALASPDALPEGKESKERMLERFEQWFKMNYLIFERGERDTTLKHRLWTAWQVAAQGERE